MRKIVLLILIFLLSFKLSAKSIHGIVICLQDSMPVSYATLVVVNTHHVAFSDQEGKFNIARYENDTSLIRISCIGYETLVQKVPPSNSDIIIFLNRVEVNINEVVVSADNFLKSLLNKAFLRIPINYPSSATLYDGYYTQKLVDSNSDCLQFLDASVRLYKTPYTNSQNGQTEIIRSRKVKPVDNKFPLHLFGGTYSPHDEDFVKNRVDFIKADNDYDYSLNIEEHDNDTIYIISFKPKSHTTKEYQGKFGIDKHSLAYLFFDVQSTPEYLSKMNIEPQNLLTSINYSGFRVSSKYETNGSFYFFKSLNEECELSFLGKENRYVCTLEYTTDTVNDNNVNPIAYDKLTPYKSLTFIDAQRYEGNDWATNNDNRFDQPIQKQLVTSDSIFRTAHGAKSYSSEKFLQVLSRIEVGFNLTVGNTEFVPGNYSVSIITDNNSSLNFSGNIKTYYYPIIRYFNLGYNITNRWSIAFEKGADFSKNWVFKSQSLLVGLKVPVRSYGHNIYMSYHLGGYNRRNTNILESVNCNNSFSINGTAFEKGNVAGYIGEKSFGCIAKCSFNYQISHQMTLNIWGSYKVPIKTDDIFLLKEQSGFYLFRHSEVMKLSDDRISYQIDSKPSTQFNLKERAWQIGIGITF